MFRRSLLAISTVGLLAFVTAPAANSSVASDEDAQRKETMRYMAEYKGVIDKGLEWLKRNQERPGCWSGHGGQHKVAMTGLAIMALMAEGSTPSQGKYAKQIDDAVEYLIKKCQKNGLIGDMQDENDRHRYMYGHGYALMALATVYGEEIDAKRRRDLETVLAKAVDFTVKAQTRLGGWGYVSAADGNHFDEGSTVVTQLQAIRAARNAGVPVPKKVIDDAVEYFKKSTAPKHSTDKPEDYKKVAGVLYSAQNGHGGGVESCRPPLTAAGLVCRFSMGDYNSALVSQWLNFTMQRIPIDKSGRDDFGHWEYTHFYYAQAIYILGEDRHAKMRPDLEDSKLLKWSRYRKVIFEYLKEKQQNDGSWPSGVGPVFATALHLCILQLDKSNLPIFQR